MTFDIIFTDPGADALEALEYEEREYVRKKLHDIATCEFRHPRDWDFYPMDGRGDGRLRIGRRLRVTADIDDAHEVIRVRNVSRRENLYA